jgi:hypothetical protein
MPSEAWSLTPHQYVYLTPFLRRAVREAEPASPRTRVFHVLPPPLTQKSCGSSPALRTTNLTSPAFGFADSEIR